MKDASPTTAPAPHVVHAAPIGLARPASPDAEFTMRFTSTPRGARLARRLVSHRLNVWGHPYDSTANETLTLITAELVANAVRHGRVPGRDFEVRLTATGEVLRVEVSDTRGERVPLLPLREPPCDAESGRGLMLVAALADGWGAVPRANRPGKTVWAEVCCPPTRRSPAPETPQ